MQAAELAVEEANHKREVHSRPAQAAKRVRQTPMERYLARGQVTDQQFKDGERLWGDYMQSGLTATVTAKYGGGVGGGDALTPGCGPRYVAYQEAMRAVGIILSPVLSWVVLACRPADDWAREHHRPVNEGIIALRLALDALGQHYRR